MKTFIPSKYNRILLKTDGNLYRFINYTFNNSEGSFYIYLVGFPQSKKEATIGTYDFTQEKWLNPIKNRENNEISNIKISYHTTGQINFDSLDRQQFPDLLEIQQ